MTEQNKHTEEIRTSFFFKSVKLVAFISHEIITLSFVTYTIQATSYIRQYIPGVQYLYIIGVPVHASCFDTPKAQKG